MASPLDAMRSLFSSSVSAIPQAVEDYRTATTESRNLQADTIKSGLNFYQNYDKGKYSALGAWAAALGAPTKTGSLAESFSNATTGALNAQKEQRAAEMDRFEKVQALQNAQANLLRQGAVDNKTILDWGMSAPGSIVEGMGSLADMSLYGDQFLMPDGTANGPNTPSDGPQSITPEAYAAPAAPAAAAPMADMPDADATVAGPDVATSPASSNLPVPADEMLAPTEAKAKTSPGQFDMLAEAYPRDVAIVNAARDPKYQGPKGQAMVEAARKRLKESPEYLAFLERQKAEIGADAQLRVEEAKVDLEGQKAGNKLSIDQFGKKYENLENKQKIVSAIGEARKSLSKPDIFVGPYANWKEEAAKIGVALGLDQGKLEASLGNTTTYRSFMETTVIPRMRELGGNDTDTEFLRIARQAGADTTMGKKALEMILDFQEKQTRGEISALAKTRRTLDGKISEGELEVPPLPLPPRNLLVDGEVYVGPDGKLVKYLKEFNAFDPVQ